MSAVRREQPIRLTTERGIVGALVTDATHEELSASLAADRRWLHGGESVDDDNSRVVGFLNDASQNPGGHETAEEYLRHTDERSANYRAVRRVWLRIQAVVAEMTRRTEEATADAQRRRDDARAWLSGFVESVPVRSQALHQRAAEVADAWALIAPIARALELLQASYPSVNSNLQHAHHAIAAAGDRAARTIGAPTPQVEPLPAGLPSYEDVRRASNALRTTDWASGSLPATGLERVELDRVIQQAGG